MPGQSGRAFLKENALFLAFLLVLAGGYLYLRQGASSVATVAEFDSLLARGKPALVEFYADT